jgi:hypothetical protein
VWLLVVGCWLLFSQCALACGSRLAARGGLGGWGGDREDPAVIRLLAAMGLAFGHSTGCGFGSAGLAYGVGRGLFVYFSFPNSTNYLENQNLVSDSNSISDGKYEI